MTEKLVGFWGADFWLNMKLIADQWEIWESSIREYTGRDGKPEMRIATAWVLD